MDYLKGMLGGGTKKGGNVLGSGSGNSTTSSPATPTTWSSPSAASAPAPVSYDVTFTEADTQLGMILVPSKAGVPVVGSVVQGGAAQANGVQAGDRVVGVDGNPVPTFEALEVVLCAMERPVVFGFQRRGGGGAPPGSPKRRRGTDDATDVRRNAMLAAAEERNKAWDKRMGRARVEKKSGEGLEKFQAANDEATKKQVAAIKAYEQAQANALGYNPYESSSMSRAVAQARIELSAPAPGGGRMMPMAASLAPGVPLAGQHSLGMSSSSSSSATSSPATSSPFHTPDVASGPQIPPLSLEEYESPEAYKANEEADVAMSMLLDQDLQVWRGALSTVLKIVTNVLSDPFQEKFRRIRLQNPTFQAKVSAVPGALDMLHAAGFIYVSEGEESTFLALPLPAPSVPLQTRVIYFRLLQSLEPTHGMA